MTLRKIMQDNDMPWCDHCESYHHVNAVHIERLPGRCKVENCRVCQIHAILAKPYHFEFYRDEDGDIVISIQEFPGCTAHDSTYSEAIQRILEVAFMWLDISLEQGLSIPEPRPE